MTRGQTRDATAVCRRRSVDGGLGTTAVTPTPEDEVADDVAQRTRGSQEGGRDERTLEDCYSGRGCSPLAWREPPCAFQETVSVRRGLNPFTYGAYAGTRTR